MSPIKPSLKLPSKLITSGYPKAPSVMPDLAPSLTGVATLEAGVPTSLAPVDPFDVGVALLLADVVD